MASDQQIPHHPAPEPVSLEAASTAVVVLDLNEGANNPAQTPYPLLKPIRVFLDWARNASVPIIYTIVAREKGTPNGEVAAPLGRRPEEIVLYPDGFDKFWAGELRPTLEKLGTKTIVFTGGAANFALMYTATTAARVFQYSIVIPQDGIYARSDYEKEYVMHQFTVLPRTGDKFRFTELSKIEFR